MLKPATGTVCFEDEEQGSGVFIRRDDTTAYAKAITEVLRALEQSPEAAQRLGVFELTALKSLGTLLRACEGGPAVAPKIDLRQFSECLKAR